jgi:hypothetical protein
VFRGQARRADPGSGRELMRPKHLFALPEATDPVFVLTGEPRALLPPRDYPAVVARHEIQTQFGRRTLVVWFKVVAVDTADARYDRVHVPMYFPMMKRTFSAGSKFAVLWARLSGRRPRKGERMSTAVLRNRLLTIRTRTVTEDHRQRPHGALTAYSVVDEIVSIDAGGSAERT